MSDDDDIFNVPTKRADENKLFMPNEESEEADYDFIEVKPVIKKPTKLTKSKQVPVEKPIAKNSKTRKAKELDEQKPAGKTSPEEATVAPPSRRDLSPVSQMILEMEQREHQVHKPPKETIQSDIDDALAEMPVARRTRAGRRSLNPPPPDGIEQSAAAPAAKKPSPPRQRASRGKKKSTTATTTRQTQANTIPSMFLAGPRGNRHQVAEIAARARVVDTIDMVTAVMPPIEGFVNLDSDEENSPAPQLEGTSAKETKKYDFDNPEIDVNLSWQGEIQMYKLRQYQKFAQLFKEISERNNVPVDDIVINMDANLIKPQQTPKDVGLKVFHILNGYPFASGNKPAEPTKHVDLYTKPKKFQLKVQGDRWKRPLIILMNKTDSFKVLYIKCAEEMECSVDDFKLFFDGELLEPDDTPRNQEMEGNEMIDFRKKIEFNLLCYNYLK
ncbi:DNA repair protein Rad60 isoform X2 [Drosophila sulfurigaster albostrigata]|uniref:DNA repair protein Rad60 isoform X2 n=1 Tax=Drosophila sulfurigaster albostrigata TaxID=89887 RepID=UPI002D21B56A|nr:DNA repair protein Rad60 isoform X2 [Drosophila sulfurigaster albostrigata]